MDHLQIINIFPRTPTGVHEYLLIILTYSHGTSAGVHEYLINNSSCSHGIHGCHWGGAMRSQGEVPKLNPGILEESMRTP